MAIAISMADLRKGLSDFLLRTFYKGERVIVKRRGKPIAAIIGIKEYETFVEIMAEERRRRFELIRQSAERINMPEHEARAFIEDVLAEARSATSTT